MKILTTILFLTALVCYAQESQPQITARQFSDKAKQRLIEKFATQMDTVLAGHSFNERLTMALRFADNTIANKIGADNFKANYQFGYCEVFWASIENELLTEHEAYTEDRFASIRFGEKIKDSSTANRIIYRYNIRYTSILKPKRGFTLYLELAGNKSSIRLEGLAKLTSERNLVNIIPIEKFLKKLKKLKFKGAAKQFVKEQVHNIDNIGLSYQQIPNSLYNDLTYYISFKDGTEFVTYRFDPWTAKIRSVTRCTAPCL